MPGRLTPPARMSVTMMVSVRAMPALCGPTRGLWLVYGRRPWPAPGCTCPARLPCLRSHLQCTTMGPAPGMLLWALFTSSRKPRTPESVVWPPGVLVVLHCAPRLLLGGEGG